MTRIIVTPICAGERVTVTPASSSALILSVAVPLPPLMMAPAWPMRRPGGAVRPEDTSARIATFLHKHSRHAWAHVGYGIWKLRMTCCGITTWYSICCCLGENVHAISSYEKHARAEQLQRWCDGMTC